MAYKKHLLVGRITRTHGFRGVVSIKTEADFSDSITEMEWVFLEIDARPVPFFIESFDHAGADILRVKFRGYDNPSKVREFIGCNVFTTHDVYPNNLPGDTKNLQGFELHSDTDDNIGIIKDILYNPGQILLKVISEAGKEILIPLHENLILQVDPDRKKLTIKLPPGLLDIN